MTGDWMSFIYFAVGVITGLSVANIRWAGTLHRMTEDIRRRRYE